MKRFLRSSFGRRPARREAKTGALAQLGERLICIQEVIGSIPIGSTKTTASASTAVSVCSSCWTEIDIVKREHQRCGIPREGCRRDPARSYPDRICATSATLSKSSMTNQTTIYGSSRDELRFIAGSIHAFGSEKPCFFWIKSSARRAFGGCLGSKRR